MIKSKLPSTKAGEPDHVTDPRTVLTLVRLFVGCDHPEPGQSVGVIIDSDGSRKSFSWCGACGAVRLPGNGDDEGDWLRTGVAQALSDEDRLAVVVRALRLRLERLAQLTKTAHAACALSREPLDSQRPALLLRLQEIDAVGEDLVRFVRREFGEESP